MVDHALPRADQFEVFHAYWRRLAADAGGVPSRLAFNPAELKDLLPFIFILERRSAEDIYVRLAGTAIEQVLRRAPTGGNYLDMCHPDERAFFRDAFTAMVDTPCGGFFRRELSLTTGEKQDLRSKCLPFKDREGHVRYLIGLTSIRADLRLTSYDPPVMDVSKITDFFYLDTGAGVPESVPPMPKIKPAATPKPTQ
ncbi:PAS domain-containing protein [Kordiimonas aestuarii]|uniref:PAS domain-containing protein n=1 Tax=Kordiimonas aestuarii TaxID=1005925 RepID=UPI0021D3D49E|nr:PAS domain-containing protein [Kordiimonas aestuarii]